MEKPLARWIMHRYSLLYHIFNTKLFSYEQAKEALHADAMTSITLASLRKNGWLTVTLDQTDLRKRNYTLKNPLTVIQALATDYEEKISQKKKRVNTRDK